MRRQLVIRAGEDPEYPAASEKGIQSGYAALVFQLTLGPAFDLNIRSDSNPEAADNPKLLQIDKCVGTRRHAIVAV